MNFTKSDKFNLEYCATIVEIGEVTPIEGSDFLGLTIINNEPVVVRKDKVFSGDVMCYVSNECEICAPFLSVNNLFDLPNYQLNDNAKEVAQLIESKQDTRGKVGFFNKYGRVRAIRLKGQLSMGYLVPAQELEKWLKEPVYWDNLIGTDFDTINDIEFVKAYVPRVQKKERTQVVTKKKEKFNKIIPGTFEFHYNTTPLKRAISAIKKTDKLFISVKVHGTSIILANLPCKKQVKLPLWKRVWNGVVKLLRIDKEFPDYVEDYGVITSSRSVVKEDKDDDIWTFWGKKLNNYVPKNFTLYGEVVGFTPSGSAIQKDYDYKCEPNQSKFMLYRMTEFDPATGKHKELSMDSVYEYGKFLHSIMPEEIMLLPKLAHQDVLKLYPQLKEAQEFDVELLQLLGADTRFKMEENEPLCKNKVPREGICIRIDNDPMAECFKLKCEKFMNKEREAIDAGQVDIEMQENV